MRRRWSARAALCLLLLAGAGLIGPLNLRAASPIRVSLVVVFPDHTLAECVEVIAEDPKGADVLRAAGLRLVTDSSFGLGEAVCKIEGTGCDYPAQQCFCECMGATCAYWNYWYWEAGAWVHSPMGASNRSVADGAMEAWVWGGDQDAPPSPDELSGLCQPPTPTPTETLVPTETLIPTETWTPSPSPSLTPEPSLTPTPTATLPPSVTPTPSLSPTATASSEPSTTLDPSPTDVATATATRTVTPSPTVAEPTPSYTPWSAYPYGTPTIASAAGSTGTPWSAYPLVTATRTRTPTAMPLSPSVATSTPRPTPIRQTIQAKASPTIALANPTAAPAGMASSGSTASTPPDGYPPPVAAQALARGALASAAHGSVEAEAAPLAQPAQGLIEPLGAPTPDRVAMVLATAVARAQASPTPPPPPEREPRRQYGVFVGLALPIVLVILYAHLLRRQRNWRRQQAWRHTHDDQAA